MGLFRVFHFDSFPAFSVFLQVIQFVYNTICIECDLRGGNIIIYMCILSSLSKSVPSLAYHFPLSFICACLSIQMLLSPGSIPSIRSLNPLILSPTEIHRLTRKTNCEKFDAIKLLICVRNVAADSNAIEYKAVTWV